MKGKLFGRTNPNDLLFNVETQEGSEILEGDDGIASIGDAVMNHMQALSGIDRMAHDEFIQVRDGNLFRIEENPRWDDPDEFNLRSKDQLSRFMQMNKLPVALRGIYQEAMEREDDRSQSEDVMDHPESLIPYEDWEKFGGMSKYWDVPSTPRPKLAFAGNTRQAFYDEFPEDHPLAGAVNRVLFTLDGYDYHRIMTRQQILQYNLENPRKPISRQKDGPIHLYSNGEEDYLCVDDYAEVLRRSIMNEKADFQYKTNTYEALKDMVLAIGKDTGNPVELVREMLRKIDNFHFHNYKFNSALKTKKMDPLYAHLCVYSRQLLVLAKKGKSVYNELKAFGQGLFRDGFLAMKEFQAGELCNRSCKGEGGCQIQEPGHVVSGVFATVQRPRRHHWAKYNATKKEIENLLEKRSQSGSFSEVVQKCVDKMQKVRDEAIEASSLRKFTSIASSLINSQKSGKMVLAPSEWAKIWAAYNTCKQEITQQLSRG
jgi:hypothetical protein